MTGCPIDVGGAQVVIREFIPDVDRGCVFSTWLSSHKRACRQMRMIMPTGVDATIDRLLDTPSVRTVVLSSPNVVSTVHGWACGDTDRTVLHYAFVYPTLRRQGMCRKLITELFGYYPHRIECSFRWPSKSSRYVYSPIKRLAA